MLFPTFEFGIFFLIVFVVSWELRRTVDLRKLFLLAASYTFYGWWDWRFVGLLVVSSLANYLFGRALGGLERDGLRRTIVGLAVIANLSVLGFFKYYGFFLESLDDILITLGLERDLRAAISGGYMPLHFLLPAACGRSDCSGGAFSATAGGQANTDACHGGPRYHARSFRLDQEDGDCQLPRD